MHSVQCLTGAVCGDFKDIRATLKFSEINTVQPQLEEGGLASMTSSKGPFLRNFRQCSCTNRSVNPSCVVSHSSGGGLTPGGPFNRSLSNRPQVSAMPPRFCSKYLKRTTVIPNVRREITQSLFFVFSAIRKRSARARVRYLTLTGFPINLANTNRHAFWEIRLKTDCVHFNKQMLQR